MPGASKPSGSTVQTQKTEPWEEAKPFIKYGLSEAGRLYGTGVTSPGTPQYDYAAYQKALDAHKSGGGGTPTDAEWRGMSNTDPRKTAYAQWVSSGKQGASPWQGTASGAMPTLEQFAIPGSQAPTNSLLAPDYYPGYRMPATGKPSASLGTGLDSSISGEFLAGTGDPNAMNSELGVPTWQVINAMKQLGYGAPGQTTATAWNSIQSNPEQMSKMRQLLGQEGENVGMMAPQSQQTLTAQNLLEQRALAGSPVTNSAKGLLTDTLDGRYLDPATNPGFKQGLEDIKKAYRTGTAAQTDAAFGRSGIFGGSAYKEAVEGNERAYGDSLLKFGGDMYNNERQRQIQGMLFAPSMAAQDYADANVLAGVGAAKEGRTQDIINQDVGKYNYGAQLPLNALANYQNLISGNFGNSMTSTQPYYQNQAAGILGGGLGLLSGASMANNLGLFGAGGLGGIFGTGAGFAAEMGPFLPALAASDSRLKENIMLAGIENGHKIYHFNYRGDPAKTRYCGVMAQEVLNKHPEAIHVMPNGFLAVDYSEIGVKFRALQ